MNFRFAPRHVLRGNLLENLVVVEALKHRFNQGRRSDLFFRDNKNHEVDLLYTLADRLIAIEAKAGETITRRFFNAFKMLRELLANHVGGVILVHDGDEEQTRHDVAVTDPCRFVAVLERMEQALIAGA